MVIIMKALSGAEGTATQVFCILAILSRLVCSLSDIHQIVTNAKELKITCAEISTSSMNSSAIGHGFLLMKAKVS